MQDMVKVYGSDGQMRLSLAALPSVSSGLSTLLGEEETLQQDASVHNKSLRWLPIKSLKVISRLHLLGCWTTFKLLFLRSFRWTQ